MFDDDINDQEEYEDDFSDYDDEDEEKSNYRRQQHLTSVISQLKREK